VEVKERKPREGSKAKQRRGGRIAGRLRLAVVDDRTADSLCGFVEAAVDPASDMVVTDAWQGYASLAKRGYQHLAVAENDDPKVAEDYLPIVHLIFSNLKAWLNGVHHGVGQQHLQAYLNEFTFRFNRRHWPMNSFRSLLGLSAGSEAPTYDALYSGEWEHPTFAETA
jgi:transposase-like protein